MHEVVNFLLVLKLLADGWLLSDGLLGSRLLGLCCFLGLLVVGCRLGSSMDWLVSLGSGFVDNRCSRLRGFKSVDREVSRDFSVMSFGNRGVFDLRWAGMMDLRSSLCMVYWGLLVVNWSLCMMDGSLYMLNWSRCVVSRSSSVVSWSSSVVSRSSMGNWCLMLS